jgi:ketosteroid isomerase-like protein
MTIEDDNVALLKRLYAGWNDTRGGSIADMFASMADDVEWHSLASGGAGLEFSRCCTSKGDVERYFGELAADWAMNYYDIEEFVAQGERVVAIGRCSWTHRRTGKQIESPKADVVRIRDGKIVAFMEFFDTAQAAAAARA